jgi:hypothetical protein
MDPVETGAGRVTDVPPPVAGGAATAARLPLPEFDAADRRDLPGHGSPEVRVPHRVPVAPLRWLVAASGLVAAVALGAQIRRLLDDEERIAALSWFALLAAVVCIGAILAWTWAVVENARRLLSIAHTSEPPNPVRAMTTWVIPFVFVAGAATTITILSRHLISPSEGTTSTLPFVFTLIAIIVVLVVLYWPISYLSGLVRRLGGPTTDLVRWAWIPIAMTVLAAGMITALHLGGVFEEEYEGIAPPWAFAVTAIPLAAIVALLGWRGALAVEDAVDFAYDRRRGVRNAGLGRGRVGLLTRALRADAAPPIHRDVRKRIRLLPGAGAARLALVTAIAALALVGVVGALVMFLFWREARDGVLIQSQRDRAWDMLDQLGSLERLLAFVVLGLVSIWSFVNVLNARLASGRRRNPLLAALAWPVAVVVIWTIADRVDGDGSLSPIVGFAAQIAVLYVPFFLLERAAITVGAARGPIRVVFALGAVLLVHIQGLAGLSTLEQTADTELFGRLAGYLAVGAVLGLITTIAVTEASRSIADGARREADEHNFLADQRSVARRPAPGSAGRDDQAGPTDPGDGHPAASGAGAPLAPPTSGVTIAASSAPPPPPGG